MVHRVPYRWASIGQPFGSILYCLLNDGLRLETTNHL